MVKRLCTPAEIMNTQTPKAGHLTKETFTALLHTVVLLVKDLFDNHKLNYVMLGRFHTDNLEARFSQYRMLSGTNYLLSIKEVIQK